MAGKTATEELELTEVGGGTVSPDLVGGEGGGNGGDGSEGVPQSGIPQRVYITGIWLALASILMFFMALTSAFIVRKGLSTDWVGFDWPRILWWNTAVLLASSFTLEQARRALGRGTLLGFQRWWGITTVLGLVFLAGQVVAWRELAAVGVYLATNPSSSFFYLLTATHGVHLGGGLVALAYVGLRQRPAGARVSRETATNATAIYWHFLGALWVFLFLLLQFGR